MMESLQSLYLPGAVPLWCSVLFAILSLWGYSRALRPVEAGPAGQERAAADLRFARRAYGGFALSIVLASLVLGFALVTRDFRIEYVFQYSGLELPIHYQFAAFWAGQKGSFLIWLLWGALLGLPLWRTAGRQEPPVMIVYTLTLLGLLFILVRENPFVMLAHTPMDGQGLNPLLQDDWMVIHPPIMFVGYAAAAIPFSFAIASLWRRDTSSGWATRAFPWTLGGFLVLGTAILMGGYWAYKTLGWGGYWGWDPVENASLVPWIFGAMLIHGLHMERTKKRFRRSNYVLAVLVFLAVLYGTFLTRSGVLADFSVHSFVDLGISGWLVFMMAFFSLLSVGLMALRLRHVPTRPNEDPLISRGTAMTLGVIAMMASGIVILFGTSAPLLTAVFPNPGQVGPEFYNRVNMPIALLVALLLGSVPFLTWRGVALRDLAVKLVPAAVASLVVTGGAAFFGVLDPFHLLYVFLASLAIFANLHKAFELTRMRGLTRAGGYLTHVGVGIMLLGFIASSGYDRATKVTLPLGEPRQVGDMTLTFQGFLEKRSAREKDAMVVDIERGGEVVRTYPKLFRNERSGQIMANPDVRSTPLQDLYVSPLQYDPGSSGETTNLRLARGESEVVGPWRVSFEDFDLNIGDTNALVAMAQQSDPVTLGVRVALASAEGAGQGEGEEVTALYRFDQRNGRVETPPARFGAGGAVMVTSIDATNGTVSLALQGLPGASGDEPPSLAIDVTTKPLIQLVWGGLYVILFGGLLSTVLRLRQARQLEALGIDGPAPDVD